MANNDQDIFDTIGVVVPQPPSPATATHNYRTEAVGPLPPLPGRMAYPDKPGVSYLRQSDDTPYMGRDGKPIDIGKSMLDYAGPALQRIGNGLLSASSDQELTHDASGQPRMQPLGALTRADVALGGGSEAARGLGTLFGPALAPVAVMNPLAAIRGALVGGGVQAGSQAIGGDSGTSRAMSDMLGLLSGGLAARGRQSTGGGGGRRINLSNLSASDIPTSKLGLVKLLWKLSNPEAAAAAKTPVVPPGPPLPGPGPKTPAWNPPGGSFSGSQYQTLTGRSAPFGTAGPPLVGTTHPSLHFSMPPEAMSNPGRFQSSTNDPFLPREPSAGELGLTQPGRGAPSSMPMTTSGAGDPAFSKPFALALAEQRQQALRQFVNRMSGTASDDGPLAGRMPNSVPNATAGQSPTVASESMLREILSKLGMWPGEPSGTTLPDAKLRAVSELLNRMTELEKVAPKKTP